jgi:hypothetical protein
MAYFKLKINDIELEPLALGSATFLEFFTTATMAGIITTDFGLLANIWFRPRRMMIMLTMLAVNVLVLFGGGGFVCHGKTPSNIACLLSLYLLSVGNDNPIFSVYRIIGCIHELAGR